MTIPIVVMFGKISK